MANNISLKKTITTSSFQCDFSRNMKISAMQRIFQDVADWHCAKFQLDFDSLREYDLAFLVSRIHIHIYQPPKFGDKLTVSTWHHTEIGAQFIRNSNITRGKTMLVEASTSWLLYSPALHKICRPNMLPRELPHCSRKVEPKIDKFIVPSDIKLRSTHKVEYAEIDMNGHLNNSVYPDIICNVLSEKLLTGYIKDIEISYISEAKLNDLLQIYYDIIDNKYYFRVFHDRGKCFEAIIEVCDD